MKDNYCRICLKSTRFLKSIIEPQTSFCVLTFINKLCNVAILENEEFSNKICKSCLDKLTIAHNIRSTCIASDNKLRQQIIPTKTSSDPSTNIKTEIQEEILEVKSLHNNIETFNNEESTVFSKREANDKNESESPLHGFKSKISRDKSSEKSHMCSICGKTFFTLSHLRSHELIHKNTKDFTCHSCGKEFLKKSYLNRHIKSHLNERNYKCKICDKVPIVIELLLRNLTWNVCNICFKDFRQPCPYRKHMQTHVELVE
ncbi:CLUMA_CG014958, isoform A [Clunio marinus]|uniref:CLUMA_CG014958, isoform A n=1 Tax=Clunio marinus TaxID=568069 RepID=A0A1J1IRN3_9DIPT|nr:CLUMA_CG014958, isoform A [Clunio marinus]